MYWVAITERYLKGISQMCQDTRRKNSRTHMEVLKYLAYSPFSILDSSKFKEFPNHFSSLFIDEHYVV